MDKNVITLVMIVFMTLSVLIRDRFLVPKDYCRLLSLKFDIKNKDILKGKYKLRI